MLKSGCKDYVVGLLYLHERGARKVSLAVGSLHLHVKCPRVARARLPGPCCYHH